jgi:eukaryotic-like serine/threonine-protein kinase
VYPAAGRRVFSARGGYTRRSKAMRTRSTLHALAGLQLPERYEVRRHIANGGMATVWCAEDLVLGRTVAIKVLAEHFAHDERAVQRFMREARAAARVSSHPHVVTIYDIGETTVVDGARGRDGAPVPGPAFIVMEHLAGGTVSDALRIGPIQREESLRWLREAASALDHAHAQGVVHRDIKPANFLLDRGRALYVADFGIARLLSEDTITSAGELFGTAAYLSPEQALGRSGTAASDRYALAVAAFELLVGARPFTATNFAAQARQHIEDPPPRASERNPELPRAADAVLARGMAKRPEDRYGTAGAFLVGLATTLGDGSSATARRLAGGVGAPRRARARRAVVGTPGAVSAAGVAATAAGRPAPTERTPQPPPLPRPARRTGRAFALAALFAAVLGIGLIAALGQSGTSTVRQLSARRGPRPKAAHAPKPGPRASAGTTSTTTTAPQTTPTAPAGADQLEAQGHQLMLSGSYAAAVPTLRRAVASADPGSLLQGYALYDLGRSLFLAGDPAAAVPILQQRLQIHDQIPVVRALLATALAASGQVTGQGGPGPPGAGASGPTGPGSGGSGANNGGGDSSGD